MKFGVHEVIRPLSLDRIVSDRKLYIAGEVKGHVEKVAHSVKVEDDQQPLRECIAAIKELQAGHSDYTAIEFFTDGNGIRHMNVCHMQNVA